MTLTLPAKIKENLTPELQEELVALSQPAVNIDWASPAKDSSQSYVAGHPFTLAHHEWPIAEGSGQPMTFLLQVNFAEVPEALPNFPRAGMIQWFVDGADDTMGMRWGKDATGKEGLFVRWIGEDELAQDSTSKPNDKLPYDEMGINGPLQSLTPLSLKFTPTLALPALSDFSEGIVSEKISPALNEALDAIWDDTELYMALEDLIVSDYTVGGTPVLVQGDPRVGREGPKEVLLQVGSDFDVLMWGDVGTAQLFGDPVALAKGDLKDCWWDWACS